MIVDGVEFPDHCLLCGGEMKSTDGGITYSPGVACRNHQDDQCVGLGIWSKHFGKKLKEGHFFFFSGIWKEKNNGHEMTLDEFERYLKLRSFE